MQAREIILWTNTWNAGIQNKGKESTEAKKLVWTGGVGDAQSSS